MPEPQHSPAPADPLRENVLGLLTDVQHGSLALEDALEKFDDLLAGLPLYPAAPVLALGDALGEPLERLPGLAIEITLRLVSSSVRSVRGVAVAVIHRLARFQPAIWVDTVRHMVRDDDWEVRDLAAHAFDTLETGDGAVDFHLGYVTDVVRGWVGDEDYLLRRAASQALLGYAARHADFRGILLDLLDPLLEDDLEYVRRSHAAALRALGRADPAAVFEYLEASLETISGYGRETFHFVLEHPFANRLPERKTALLARL